MQKKHAAFISIPKCASKTILAMFKLGPNRDDDTTAKQYYPIIYENHQRLAVLEQRYNLDNVFLFTFVRHPYDRIISWYFYHQTLLAPLTLEQWIAKGCPHHWKVQNKTNWAKKSLSPLLQTHFLTSPQHRNVDFVGKLEHFERDVKRLIGILNARFKTANVSFRLTYTETRRNVSTRRPQKVKLGKVAKDKIYQLFKADFEKYGYTR